MLATEVDARQLVAGRRVAIVGSAPEVLDTDLGNVINGHDVVIRFNRAIPSNDVEWQAIGSRTDVLVGGLFGDLSTIPIVPPWVWWTKHTPLGDQHLREIENYRPWHKTRVWHVPRGIIEPENRAVGRSVSSAIAVTAACGVLDAARISLFGISCWGKLEPGSQNHWWKYERKYEHFGKLVSHDAAGEAEWIRDRCFQRGRLWWEVK